MTLIQNHVKCRGNGYTWILLKSKFILFGSPTLEQVDKSKLG